ncbi:MAG: dTMP kinase [Oscillospiraceae bacterium]|nr:dTMP kinase [Oscillospiraceae bacterium]
MKMQMREHNKQGFLITFCGLDGCGKSTLITLLKEYLEGMDISVVLTKQPTDFVRKSNIFRTYMDQPNHDAFDYRALSLLCASDRVQHTNRVIMPLLKKYNAVISDRYFYSCLANLQARGYTQDIWIYDIAKSIPHPDIAFFLDVPVETAVERVRQRPKEKERFIDMDLQFRLREQYLKIAEENGGIAIDSSKTPQETFSDVLSVVAQKNIIKTGVHSYV